MSQPEIASEVVHGTALALGDKAVLIRGASGTGKSDLALRCMTAAPLDHLLRATSTRIELVSDDQVCLVLTGAGIEASPPPPIAGKIEIRGLGIVEVPWRAAARLALVVDLVSASDVPRYPLDAPKTVYFGHALPLLRLAPFEASAPVKLIMALERCPDVRKT